LGRRRGPEATKEEETVELFWTVIVFGLLAIFLFAQTQGNTTRTAESCREVMVPTTNSEARQEVLTVFG